jgi:hypothetical protein
MRRKALICALYALSLVTAGWLLAPHGVQADPGKGKGNDGPETVNVELTADDEVPIAISDASGTLQLTIDAAGASIGYVLTYTALEGNVTQAHIHIGQKNVAGGIVLWLCQTATNPSPATVPAAPTCPAGHSGSVSGTLTSANIVPNVQAVNTDSLADVIDAIHRGKAYGNVHSSVSGGGEIRGQLHHH